MSTSTQDSYLATCRRNAKHNAERGAQAGRMLATRAAGGIGNLAASIAGPDNSSLAGLLGMNSNQSASRNYAYYKDWPYVVLNAISRRLSGLPYAAGTIKREGQKLVMVATKAAVAVRRYPTNTKQISAGGRAIEQLESHPALDFLQRPNKIQGKSEFLQCTILNLFLTGEFYWLGGSTKRRAGSDGEPAEATRELWCVPTSWITPKHDGGLFTSYVLKIPGQAGAGVDLPAEVVHRGYFPDPQDFKRAVSPVSAEARAVKIDERIQDSQALGFERGMFPQMAVVVGDKLGPNGENMGKPTLTGAQRRQIIRAIREVCLQQTSNGDPAIIDGMIADIKRLQAMPAEMDWMQSGEAVKKRIFQAFGINPIVVGEITGANRAQAAVADQNYVDNVINPLADKVSCALQDFVVPLFDEDGDPNSGLAIWLEEAKPKDEELDLRKISQARAGGSASRNEERTILGLPPIDGESGNIVGLASTTTGATGVQQLLIAVSTGQIVPDAAKELLVLTYGYTEDQAERLVITPEQAAMPSDPKQLERYQWNQDDLDAAETSEVPATDDAQPAGENAELPAVDGQSETGKRIGYSKFDESQPRDEGGQWTDGGGSSSGAGSGSSYESYNDRIEGTQAEADREVKRANNKVEKIRSALDSLRQEADAAADVAGAKAVVDYFQERLDEVASRKAKIIREIEASNERLAALKAKLKPRRPKKDANDDAELLKDIDAELRTLAKAHGRMAALADDIDELLDEIEAKAGTKSASLPRLTRHTVKAVNARQRAQLESEAAVGLRPFFERSCAESLQILLDAAGTSRRSR